LKKKKKNKQTNISDKKKNSCSSPESQLIGKRTWKNEEGLEERRGGGNKE
jgi:hypothetical protein